MEDSISFLTPTGKLPLNTTGHSSSIQRPVQLWLAHIPSPLFSFTPMFFSLNNCILLGISCRMLIWIKDTSEVVAATAILNPETPVSLPVPCPLLANLLFVYVYQPQVQADPWSFFRRLCRARIYFFTAICLSSLGRSRLAPVIILIFIVPSLLG